MLFMLHRPYTSGMDRKWFCGGKGKYQVFGNYYLMLTRFIQQRSRAVGHLKCVLLNKNDDWGPWSSRDLEMGFT